MSSQVISLLAGLATIAALIASAVIYFLTRPHGKRTLIITVVVTAVLIVAIIAGTIFSPRLFETSQLTLTPTPTLPPCPPLNSTNSKPGLLSNLEDDTSRWGVFPDGDSPAECVSSPSRDGTALRASLDYGHDFQVYRNLAAVGKAVSFELSLSFYFTSATHIQALAFSMNKWTNGQRWEWALQWENKPDNTPEAGNPPTWRVWDGYGDGSKGIWRDTHIMQQLSPNAWHTLDLKGDISSNGQVHYISFRCDTPPNQPSNQLGQTFNPASETGEKLAVAVQLDTDAQGGAYQVYVDEMTFQFKPV